MSLPKEELIPLATALFDNGALKIGTIYDFAVLREDGTIKYTYGDHESTTLSDKPKDAWPLVAIDPALLEAYNKAVD